MDEHIKHKLFPEDGLGHERPFELSGFGLVKSEGKNIPVFLAQADQALELEGSQVASVWPGAVKVTEHGNKEAKRRWLVQGLLLHGKILQHAGPLLVLTPTILLASQVFLHPRYQRCQPILY